jgi:hypothetical protein
VCDQLAEFFDLGSLIRDDLFELGDGFAELFLGFRDLLRFGADPFVDLRSA